MLLAQGARMRGGITNHLSFDLNKNDLNEYFLVLHLVANERSRATFMCSSSTWSRTFLSS